MARVVTLTNLLTQIRQRADIESATARFPDAELTVYTNDGISEVYDLIREAYGSDYYMATTTPALTTPGTSLYSLPSNFISLDTVDIVISPSITISGKPYTKSQRNLLKNLPFGPVAWTQYTPVWYRLKGSNINFLPTPAGQYSFTIDYVPTPTPLVSGGDNFDGVNGWDEYVVLHAAAKCMQKEQDYETAQSLNAEKAAVAERIRKMAPERDQGAPARVQDVYEENADYY